MTSFPSSPEPNPQLPASSPLQGAGDVCVFAWPEAELVQAVRDGLAAHKRRELERNGRWIAHCLELLNEGETK